MDVGKARNRVSEGNEGTVGDVEKNIVMRTNEVAEERDLVGVYLHEISRTPLLDAAPEVDLSKAIEAGLYAEHLLERGRGSPTASAARSWSAWSPRGPRRRTCSSGPTCGWSSPSPAGTSGPACRCST